MFDPHPPFASFAPSLIILIAILEILNFVIQKSNFSKDNTKFDLNSFIKIISTLGLIAVISAFISGYFANGFIDQNTAIENKDKLISPLIEDKIQSHHLLGRLLLILYIPFIFISLIRNNSKNLINFFYYFLLLVILALALGTSYYGGELVFEYGVGVNKQIY